MQDEILRLLGGRRGHFQMESGYHSEFWFNLDSLFETPEKLRPFVIELARRLSVQQIQAVCGPMTGGAKLARLISAELGIRYFFTERIERPGAVGFFPVNYVLPAVQREAVRDTTVAIVDDAVSAGSAVRGTFNDLIGCGARPVALGALFVFGDHAERFATENDMSLERIAQTSFSMWKPAECPLCQAGVALEKITGPI